jgi:hypothetical protein
MTWPRPAEAVRGGWALLIWGAPWSHAAMSVGVAWVAVCALWLAMKTPPSWNWHGAGRAPWFWLVLMLGWQTVTLSWTTDMEWGARLWLIQLPMLLLAGAWQWVPLPFDKASTWVFRSAGLGLMGCLVWGTWKELHGVELSGRDWSPWMSHIRLSTLASLGLVWGARTQPKWHVAVFVACWTAFSAATGSLTSAVLLPLSVLWVAWEAWAGQRAVLGWGIAGSVLGIVAAAAVWLQPVPLPSTGGELPEFTALGNRYTHAPERELSEGGHRVHVLVCEQEWPEAWSEVSAVPLDFPNSQGFTNRDRLLRYLTSKGWPKDGEHIRMLLPEEVSAIENGATNVVKAHGWALRVRELRREWEMWRDGGSPSGNAVFQRFAHWRAGLLAWKRAPLWGHGMGDTGLAMAESYRAMDSSLAPQHRHRAHMQHLTWAISGGLIAALLWLGLGWSWWNTFRTASRACLWGGAVVVLTCLFEDAWETQAGVVVSFLALLGASGDLST